MKKKLLLRAARGETVERTPVWVMRQAGRYLPEYHKTKEHAGGFLGVCTIPEFGIEATLQPIRRFGFDGAILFSDILIPARAMGIDLAFKPGPIINNPACSETTIEALRIPDPQESLPFVLEILKGLAKALPEETALIGFAGAPFTVATYLVEETASKTNFATIRRMIYQAPTLVKKLIDTLTQMTIGYLGAQIEAGAEIVQLFDSSAGMLPPDLYRVFCLEPAKAIVKALCIHDVPVIYFAPNAMTTLKAQRGIGANVVGIDWRIELDVARNILGPKTAVQGNLDPSALLGTTESVRENTRRVLKSNGKRPGHIFNLGHGIQPSTPIENVATMVDEVRLITGHDK
jgi:uroporphyrinogen decarboxylase